MSREPVTIELSEPTYGNPPLERNVTSLTIRCPTGADILHCGFPFSQARDSRTGETREAVEPRAVVALLARCTGLLTKSIEVLEAVDFYVATEVLKVFFHHYPRKTSSSDISKPDDGAETAPSSSA